MHGTFLLHFAHLFLCPTSFSVDLFFFFSVFLSANGPPPLLNEMLLPAGLPACRPCLSCRRRARGRGRLNVGRTSNAGRAARCLHALAVHLVCCYSVVFPAAACAARLPFTGVVSPYMVFVGRTDEHLLHSCCWWTSFLLYMNGTWRRSIVHGTMTVVVRLR